MSVFYHRLSFSYHERLQLVKGAVRQKLWMADNGMAK
jgi:hypothetical protein